MILKSLTFSPPLHIDVSCIDLFKSLAMPSFFLSRRKIIHEIESYFPDENAVCVLSIRTGFDLYLKSLNLPAGSKVLISCMTIKDMIDIIKSNQLIPVPIDISIPDLKHQFDSIKKGLEDGAKLVVVTHLFGVIHNLEEIIELCKGHQVPLIEDCAQSFCGKEYNGHKKSDLVMFSFGVIKTCSSFGGALLLLRNNECEMAIRKAQEKFKHKDYWYFLKRVFKYLPIKIISTKPLWGVLYLCGKALNIKFDEKVYKLTRSFSGDEDLIKKLNYQLPTHQLYLLKNKLRNYKRDSNVDVFSLKNFLDKKRVKYTLLGEIDAFIKTNWLLPLIVEDLSIDDFVEHGVYASKFTTSMIYLNEDDQLLLLNEKIKDIMFVQKKLSYS